MTAAQTVTDDHTATLDALVALCRPLALLPLDEARLTVEKAHALGPIFDPTAYQRGMDNLRDQAELLDAAIQLQRVVLKISGQQEARA